MIGMTLAPIGVRITGLMRSEEESGGLNYWGSVMEVNRQQQVERGSITPQ